MTKIKPSWLQGTSLLAILIFSAYFPTFQNSFIWDDNRYLTQNPYLKDIEGLKRFWLDLSAMPQYYPMVFTSFWVEHKIWGFDPIGYHVDNVVIHYMNAFILWRILVFMEIRGSWLGAAVFAIHPIQVETVAWITERKNLLSGLFLFLSLYTFIRFYDPAPGVGSNISKNKIKTWSMYGVSLLFFLCALWSKTVTCILPAVILLIFWWKQNRVSKEVFLLTVPYFVFGLSFAFLTTWLEKFNVGAIGPEWEFSFIDRFLIAGKALWFYIGKLIFPFPLIFTYPRWTIDDSIWWQYLYPLAFIALFFILGLFRNRIGRGPLAGILLFSGTLFPALGFFNVYPMRFSFVADHFQYLACIGIIVPFSCGIEMLVDRFKHYIIRVFIICFLSLLGVLTWNQSHVYKNVFSLWNDTTEKNPGAWMAHYNLGLEYANLGNAGLAVRSYELAIKYKPDHYKAHFNLGNSYRILGRFEESVESYYNALAVNPEHVMSWINLGIILGKLNKNKLAISAISKAIELRPEYANAHYNLGIIYAEEGQFEKAKEEFENVLKIDPDDQEAQNAINILDKKIK